MSDGEVHESGQRCRVREEPDRVVVVLDDVERLAIPVTAGEVGQGRPPDVPVTGSAAGGREA